MSNTKTKHQILKWICLAVVGLILMSCKGVASYYKRTKQQYTFSSQNTQIAPKSTSFKKLSPPIVLPDDFIWGVNGHTTNVPSYYFDKSLEIQIQLLKELQLTHYRINVTLGEKGEVDFWKSETPRWKNTIAQCEEAGIKLLPVIILKSANYKLKPEQIFEIAKKEAQGFAKRYKNSVAAYAMGNEMDLEVGISGTDGSKISHYNLEEFAKVIAFLKGTAAGIRLEDSNAKLIINGAGRHRYGYFEYIRQQQVDYDIIGFHWYSEMGQIPEPYLSEKDGLDIMQYMHQQFDKPIWITEINQHWGVNKHPENHQAFWMDHFIDNLEGRDYIKAFFVYELLDEPQLDDGEGYENKRQAYFGLIDWIEPYTSYRYRPAAITYKYKIEQTKRGLESYVDAVSEKLGLTQNAKEETLLMLKQGSTPSKTLEVIIKKENLAKANNKSIVELYQNLLNRTPTTNEVKFFKKQQSTLITILTSQEFYKNAIITGYNKNNAFPFNRSGSYKTLMIK